jgi:crotonobetainyl-CoA:carnitine CoA-transferase CaiB-like acyl-CoA transferase
MPPGATVIKVEQAGSKGDMMATNPVVVALLAKNKERVTLDLKHNEGKAHLERLLDGADVLVENFRPGVMAAMGFGTPSPSLLPRFSPVSWLLVRH